MPEGSRERAVPHSSGLRNYIKEETLAIHRDRGTNGNEIGENITIIKRKSRHGIVVKFLEVNNEPASRRKLYSGKQFCFPYKVSIINDSVKNKRRPIL